MKNQVENNKLIAEFMDVVFHDDENQYYDHEGYYIGLNLKYNTSWDWLMPVVKKCFIEAEKLDMDTASMEQQFGFFHVMWGNIDEAYEAVVEFIKWYNEKNNYGE